MTNLSKRELVGKRLAAELVLSHDIQGDDATDTALLQGMAKNAKRYVDSFSWCEAVLDFYFAGGIGGIFAIFFVHIRPARPEVDPWIWVMVGDVPSAYLPLEDARSPAEAFRTYMRGMSKWVELARQGKTGGPEQGAPPVSVPSTPEWAEKLNQKLNGLMLVVQPLFEGGGDAPEWVH